MTSNKIKIETMLDGEEPLFDQKYIYSLYFNDVCVYVGQTMDLRSRVYAHLGDRKSFNSVSYFICSSESANQAEADEIVKKQPTLNGNLPSTSSYILVSNLTKEVLSMINDNSNILDISYECGSEDKKKRYITELNKIKIKESIMNILSK